MNYFSPIPKLIRRTVIDGDDKYFLQTVTNCDQFNYKVSSDYSVSDEVDENGNFIVNIAIVQDNELPTNAMDLPLVHLIELGSFSAEVVIVRINLMIVSQQNPEVNPRHEGPVTISTAGAEEETRPIKAGKI